MSVFTVTDENFENEVLNSEKTVLLDFWASWCAPCRMVSPIVDELAEEHPEFLVGKVNVDEEPVLSQQFRIMSIPTLVAIKDGKVAKKIIGVHTKTEILDMLQSVD
ncbi:MAG: thioredoxin [Clostridiales bacterium]|nr:thioredoxin [Clostridiales bacterium]